MASHKGLTAAGRDSQADIWKLRQLGYSSVRPVCLEDERPLRAMLAGKVEIRFQGVKASLLVISQLQHILASISDRRTVASAYDRRSAVEDRPHNQLTLIA
jgi:hypothetical protein